MLCVTLHSEQDPVIISDCISVSLGATMDGSAYVKIDAPDTVTVEEDSFFHQNNMDAPDRSIPWIKNLANTFALNTGVVTPLWCGDNNKIRIGNDVTLHVVRVGQGRALIGFEASKKIPVID